MTGFGVAYDAAVRTLAAQARIADRRESRHHDRRQQWRNHVMLHIKRREQQLTLVQAIENQLTDPSPKNSGRHCPECKGSFILVSAAGVEIDACISCGSFWFDKGELQALTHRAADIQTLEGAVAPSRYNCPVCGIQMQQHRFLTHQDLLVDKCPDDHGFYLERDELVRSIEL